MRLNPNSKMFSQKEKIYNKKGVVQIWKWTDFRSGQIASWNEKAFILSSLSHFSFFFGVKCIRNPSRQVQRCDGDKKSKILK
jgi:hypothetical protein